MLNFNSPYVTTKPIKRVFFEPDLINATGFYFACQATWIKAVILDAACFWRDANVGSWRPALWRNSSVHRSFYFNVTLFQRGVTLKRFKVKYRLNLLSHCRCHMFAAPVIDPAFDTHTLAHRQHDSKWQSFPVDTCHPIYACLKHYHSITSLFYHDGTVNATITVIANKP